MKKLQDAIKSVKVEARELGFGDFKKIRSLWNDNGTAGVLEGLYDTLRDAARDNRDADAEKEYARQMNIIGKAIKEIG